MQRVMITGGSGSLGKALVLNLLATTDATVVVYSRDPHKQNELKALTGNHPRLRLTLGDVRDKNRLYQTMRGCDTVVHAAALKYVDIGEYNTSEYIKVNIDGTQNTIDVALELGITRALFIATDKNVLPVNMYGRTKAVAERLWIRSNLYGNKITKLSAIRYGNVFDSRGSVMECWKDKKQGDHLTVRTPPPTRFVCFVSWGVRWVRQALDMMRGGEIFVPAGLYSISMDEYARWLVGPENVSYEPLGGGEKRHELLLAPEEERVTSYHNPLWIIDPDDPQWVYEKWDTDHRFVPPYSSDRVTQFTPSEFDALYRKHAGEWERLWRVK